MFIKSIKPTAAILICLGLTSCFEEIIVELPVGTCYYEGGDLGGTPNIIHCVQAKGVDGFLKCQGSSYYNEWRWYACRTSERFRYLKKTVTVDCPRPCPDLSYPPQ